MLALKATVDSKAPAPVSEDIRFPLTTISDKRLELKDEESPIDSDSEDSEEGLQEPEPGLEEQEEIDIDINTGSNSSNNSGRGGLGGFEITTDKPRKPFVYFR